MKAPVQAPAQEDQAQQFNAGHIALDRQTTQEVGHVDNGPATLARHELQEMISTGPDVLQQKAFGDMINNSPRVLQRKALGERLLGGAVQRHEDKASHDRQQPTYAMEPSRQANFSSGAPAQLAATAARKPNDTGLPDQLKSCIESMSGISMDHVKVHYNSSTPAQLNAHAYAQGNDIHVGPGQEKSLPHEAWHVVQQVQGRVRPTMQMKDGVQVNDDKGLEAEADVMGGTALQLIASQIEQSKAEPSGPVLSRKMFEPVASGPNVAQRTSILLGYHETDDTFEANLSGQRAPNAIHTFSADGQKQSPTKESQSLIEKYKDKPTDSSTLYIIGHGSPGRVGQLDLPAFMNTLKAEKQFGAEIKDVKLTACHAMMKRDIDNESVAYQLAVWISKNLDNEVRQSVNLVAGYTANAAGAFAAGRPSYQPLDKKAIFNAHPFHLYLYYKAVKKLKENGVVDKELRERALEEAEDAGAVMTDSLLEISPIKPWAQDGSRVDGHTFTIDALGIQNEDKLSPGYTTASITARNFEDFPERFSNLQNINSVRAQVRELLDKTVDEIYSKLKPTPAPSASVFSFGFNSSVSPVGGGFTFNGGAIAPFTGGFTFGGIAPTAGSQSFVVGNNENTPALPDSAEHERAE